VVTEDQAVRPARAPGGNSPTLAAAVMSFSQRPAFSVAPIAFIAFYGPNRPTSVPSLPRSRC